MEETIDSNMYYFRNVFNVPIIQQKCLKKCGKQRYAVGDKRGVCTGFQVRKNQSVEVHFKTPESSKNNHITSVYAYKDKVFFTIGNYVVGVTRKGKNFYQIENNLDVKGFSMLKDHGFFYNDFFLYHSPLILSQKNDDENERQFLLTHEKVLDIFLPYSPPLGPKGTSKSEKTLTKVLFACNDKSYKIINFDEDFEQIVRSIKVPAVPTCAYYDAKESYMYYGTEKGDVGIIYVNEDDSTKNVLQLKSRACINCMSTIDFNQDGLRNLVVGDDRGSLRIFQGTKIMLEKNIDESVTNCVVHSAKTGGVLISSYSGKVHLLLDKSDSSVPVKVSQNTKQSLLREIKEKEMELIGLKKKYNKVSKENIATTKSYEMKKKFFLIDTKYFFSVELNAPIEMVIFQSPIPINILDSREKFDVSKEYNRKGECFFLAKSLADDNTKFDMNIRSLEGKHGDLEVFVVPSMTPKIAQRFSMRIKPLSLHERIEKEKVQYNFEDGKVSQLHVEGNFSIQHIHNWISDCLNDLPEKILSREELTFYFKSNYQDTYLKIHYKKGGASFYGNNISTISILEEYVTKAATLKKINIKIRFKINFGSVGKIVKRLYPELERQLSLNEKKAMLKSLKELSVDETEAVKDEDFLKILGEEKEIEELSKNQKVNLQFMYDILVRLIMDKCKFKRSNPKGLLEELKRLLSSKKPIKYSELEQIFK